MMNGVLILTENMAGWGHYSAARALKKALHMQNPEVEVVIERLLPRISTSLERAVSKCYLETIRHVPRLWGAAYDKERWFGQLLRGPLGMLTASALRPLIRKWRPRVIICTHSLPLAACAQLKREGADFTLGAAVTDFGIHHFWLCPEVDFYFLAHESLTELPPLKKCGSKTFATGIPVDPAFSLLDDQKEKWRRTCGLEPDRFTLLLLGGGSGIGPYLECLRHLLPASVERRWQLVVITGNNSSLHEEVRRMCSGVPHVTPLKFVHNMNEWMAAADVVIGKPGGMTTSETLAAGVPMLIINPIPGQEEKNSRFLTEKQVAIREDRPAKIPEVLGALDDEPHRLKELSRQARRIGKPRSATDAAREILRHVF